METSNRFWGPRGTELGNPLQEYLKNTNTSKYIHTFRQSKPHTTIHFIFMKGEISSRNSDQHKEERVNP